VAKINKASKFALSVIEIDQKIEIGLSNTSFGM